MSIMSFLGNPFVVISIVGLIVTFFAKFSKFLPKRLREHSGSIELVVFIVFGMIGVIKEIYTSQKNADRDRAYVEVQKSAAATATDVSAIKTRIADRILSEADIEKIKKTFAHQDRPKPMVTLQYGMTDEAKQFATQLGNALYFSGFPVDRLMNAFQATPPIVGVLVQSNPLHAEYTENIANVLRECGINAESVATDNNTAENSILILVGEKAPPASAVQK